MTNNPPSLLRIVIVEDKVPVRHSLVQLVNALDGVTVVGDYGTVDEAVAGIKASTPDLLLLDIHLKEENSFEILDQLDQLPKLIFLTGYEAHAIRAIKYGALDYLLKPVNKAELASAIQKAIPTIPLQVAVARAQWNQRSSTIVIPSQEYLQVIELEKILYCQGDAGYTTIHLSDKKKIVSSKNLKDYEEMLPAPPFIRTHQSFIVNMPHIDRYHKDGLLVLHDGTEIPVASRRRDIVVGYLKGK